MINIIWKIQLRFCTSLSLSPSLYVSISLYMCLHLCVSIYLCVSLSPCLFPLFFTVDILSSATNGRFTNIIISRTFCHFASSRLIFTSLNLLFYSWMILQLLAFIFPSFYLNNFELSFHGVDVRISDLYTNLCGLTEVSIMKRSPATFESLFQK